MTKRGRRSTRANAASLARQGAGAKAGDRLATLDRTIGAIRSIAEMWAQPKSPPVQQVVRPDGESLH